MTQKSPPFLPRLWSGIPDLVPAMRLGQPRCQAIQASRAQVHPGPTRLGVRRPSRGYRACLNDHEGASIVDRHAATIARVGGRPHRSPPSEAALTIAKMPALIASGSFGQASMTAVRSGGVFCAARCPCAVRVGAIGRNPLSAKALAETSQRSAKPSPAVRIHPAPLAPSEADGTRLVPSNPASSWGVVIHRHDHFAARGHVVSSARKRQLTPRSVPCAARIRRKADTGSVPIAAIASALGPAAVGPGRASRAAV
jgi:hypothetical protein